jgi:oxalate---CoA ligase
VEDDFFELGGDSLLAAHMILEVETLTGQRIPRSSLGAASTIRELANVVMHNVPSNEEMVTCAQRGTKTPFFFCHGDFLTRGFYGLRLGPLLGPDQTVFLLHPPPLSELRTNTSIEVIAELYVPHLLAAQPNGAFRLGGFCNGGLLAWEIARQLVGKDRQVELVVIINTISLNARPTFRAIARMLRWKASIAPVVKARYVRGLETGKTKRSDRSPWRPRGRRGPAYRLAHRGVSICRRNLPYYVPLHSAED